MSDLQQAADLLSEPPTKSTAHMEHQERADGVRQMLLDLEQLARQDGCIAAAWALEKLLAVSAEREAVANHCLRRLNSASNPGSQLECGEILKLMGERK